MDEGELKDVFVTLGANDLLDSARADLTGIIKLNENVKNRLSLEHFVYKTRVDVTGTSDNLLNVTGQHIAFINIYVSSFIHEYLL